MIQVNIADLKSRLSHYVNAVRQGESVTICARNKPVALLSALKSAPAANATQLGCLQGTVQIDGDLTEPAMDAGDWDMLQA